MSSWWWPWAPEAPKPARPSDAAHDPAIRMHFAYMLDFTEPPATFKPLQVAELLTPAQLAKLGYENHFQALPAIYELAWELREFGDCEILQKGKLLPEEVSIPELEGPVRIRRIVS